MSVFENNVFERGNLAVIVTHSISNLGESNSRDNYQIHIITDPEQSGYSLDELHDYFSLEGHRIISYDQLTLSANSPFNLQNMKALCFSDLIAKLIVESTPNGKMLGSLGPSLVDSNDYNANTLVDVDLSTVFNFLENKDVLSKIGFNVDVKPVGLTPVDIGKLYSLFPEQDIPTLEEVFNKPIQENEQITNLTNSEGIEKVVFRDSREKTYVIKKTKDRDLLEKELFLESLAKSRNIRLARWMVNSGDKQIFKQGDTYVSLWEHSIDKDHSEVDLDKKLMFSEFSRYKLGLGTNNREQERIEKLGKNLEGNSLMHKMYVLALYHATLTEVRGLDVLNQSTLSDFLDFEQFEESAAKSRPNSGSKQLTDALFSKKDYRRMVEYLEEVEKQTGECYIHDDAKDANFFSVPGSMPILGDLGSAKKGSFVRDIGRALIDSRIAKNPDLMKQCIEAYAFFRNKEEERLYGDKINNQVYFDEKPDVFANLVEEAVKYELIIFGARVSLGPGFNKPKGGLIFDRQSIEIAQQVYKQL